MVYRFFVALAFTVLVFPFVAIYTFSVSFPDAQFAFDRSTWLQGLAVIGFGWVLFLLPGLLPFVGHRYYDWVARKVGMTAVTERAVTAGRSLKSCLKQLSGTVRSSLSRQSGRHSRTPATPQNKRPRLFSLPSIFSPIRHAIARRSASHDESRHEAGSALAATRRKELLRQETAKQLDRARHALSDAPKHLAKAKDNLNTLIVKLTPDELQRTIDLNQYTLDVLSHLKRTALLLTATIEFSEADAEFVKAVLEAVPEPPSPTDTDPAPQTVSFVYPEDRRGRLRSASARRKISIRESDFELAEQGDLERALLIVQAIVSVSFSSDKHSVHFSADDPMIGLGAPAPS